MASQVLDPPPHVPLPDFADPSATPHSIGAVLRFLPATQPNQPRCVPDPLLMQGKVFSPVCCNRFLPHISNLLDLSCSCWWDSVLDRAPRWVPNVPAS